MNHELLPLKVLFVGDLNEGTRSLMRAKKISKIAKGFGSLTTTKIPYLAGTHSPTFFSRVMNKFGFPPDECEVNNNLITELERVCDYSLIWVDKSPTLRPGTLRTIKSIYPAIRIISVTEDDMFARHNRNFYIDRSLKYYDHVFTTKTYNLHELKSIGAKRTDFFLDSFDEDLHCPDARYSQISKKIYDVSFVGTYEKERARAILSLGSHGINVNVFGNGWRHLKEVNRFVTIEDRAVFGSEYVEIINKSKINLGFLRKINRDVVTSRTMEITGAEGFLIAERTNRHLSLFKEGYEAEFFSDDDELVKKITYYLANQHLISQISAHGRARAIKDRYDMKSQVLKILKTALLH